jgi:uncharacterized protein YjcR
MVRGSGGAKSPIDPEIRAEAERRLAAGEPVGRIARSLHLAPGTLRSWRRRRELKDARSPDDGVIANLIAVGRRMLEDQAANREAREAEARRQEEERRALVARLNGGRCTASTGAGSGAEAEAAPVVAARCRCRGDGPL